MVTHQPRYKIMTQVVRLCQQTGLSAENVLRRAGLAPQALEARDLGFTGAQCFAVWEAAMAEAGDPAFPILIGRASAKGPFAPSVFAFSCSPNVEIGLHRLAEFKPLVGPIALSITDTEEGLDLCIRPSTSDLTLPLSFAVHDVVHLTELVRLSTGVEVSPRVVRLPQAREAAALLRAYTDAPVEPAPDLHIVFSPEDARRPLFTENAELWRSFERDLRRQLVQHDRTQPTRERVRQVLLELLPAGTARAEDVSRRLNLSKRSLYRRLEEEGATFQRVLDETRHTLAMHYLENEAIQFAEISFLLGFSDPRSFYRAFRGWTGQTPTEARMGLIA